METEIHFDGRPDESAWYSIPPFEMIMFQPCHGSKPTEKSDIRIGFDDDYLYVGASLYYEDISMMTAKAKKRDYAELTCDWFGIHLDTYNDNPREGVDFYLVYNEGINTDLYSHIPKLPLSDTRTLMAKFTYTIGR